VFKECMQKKWRPEKSFIKKRNKRVDSDSKRRAQNIGGSQSSSMIGQSAGIPLGEAARFGG